MVRRLPVSYCLLRSTMYVCILSLVFSLSENTIRPVHLPGGALIHSLAEHTGTPFLAKLLGLKPPLALMLSQRSVSSPFGLAGAAALGA